MKSRSLCKCFKTMENRKDPGINAPGGQKHIGMSSKTMDTGSKFVQQMPQRTFLTKQYLCKPISVIISRKRGVAGKGTHDVIIFFLCMTYLFFFTTPSHQCCGSRMIFFGSGSDFSDSFGSWTGSCFGSSLFANIFNINLPFYYRLVSVLGCIHIMTRYSF